MFHQAPHNLNRALEIGIATYKVVGDFASVHCAQYRQLHFSNNNPGTSSDYFVFGKII